METIVKDDLISRKAVHKELANLQMCVAGLRFGKGVLDEFMKKYRESVLLIVGKQPTIDAAPVIHGKPVPHYQTWCNSDGKPVATYQIGYECPFCGDDGIKKLCPNCGAKMDQKG